MDVPSLTSSDPPAVFDVHRVLPAGGFDGVSDEVYDEVARILITEAERLGEVGGAA